MTDVGLFEGTQDQMDAHARNLYDSTWEALIKASVVDPKKVRTDLMTWRRGSAQMALRTNAALHNLSIYSVLVSDVQPSEQLFMYLLAYNNLQRLESLGLLEREKRWYIVLKYTMELGVVNKDSLQRHVFYLQERADELDTELANKFGGSLHFEDWDKLDQEDVDDLIGDLFG